MEMVFLVAILCVACIVYCISSSRKSTCILPPGPGKLPLVGHLHLLGARPHESMSRLSEKYHADGLMLLKLGSVPTLVVSTADAARELLTTHDVSFASRPKLTAGKVLSYGWKDIAWSSYGPYWRHMRKLCTLELFTAKRLEESRQIRSTEAHRLLQSILNKQSQNAPVNLNTELGVFSMNVILRMAFSTRPVDPKFLPSIQKLISGLAFFYVADYFPSLWWLDYLFGTVSRLKNTFKEIDDMVQDIVDKHKSGPQEQVPDLLDVMLSAEDMEDVSVKAMVMDMITAGTDTSSLTAEWAMSELLKNPQLMGKAQEEMDQVVGRDRLVDESDLPKLKYLGAVIKETFRLHPVLPLLLPRESSQPANIRGYELPSNTRVLINVWSIGRDPSQWGQGVLEFNPDMFLGKHDMDVKGRNFGLLPFGGGRRMCPGLSLGLCMVELMVALMVQSFTWTVEGDLDMKEGVGMTVHKERPLEAFASPRLASHLY